MTTELEAVHECYIAVYGHDSLDPEVLEVDSELQECQEIGITNVLEGSSVDE